MMSKYICDLWWSPYFYHKDTCSIKFSCFYLLWGERYDVFADFTPSKCALHNNSVKCVNFSKTRTYSRQAKKYPNNIID